VPTWRDSLTTPRLEPDVVLREQEAAAVARAIARAGAGHGARRILRALPQARDAAPASAAALEREQIAHSRSKDTSLARRPRRRT
jgi:hypothetical protein